MNTVEYDTKDKFPNILFIIIHSFTTIKTTTQNAES
jgi:hypothetical protein